jgi:diaminohydroxyphosphoribosylaminopyrimidine deaminase/5-amino-6-(5-phosphoribosylamino)uracil reductase
MIVTASAASEPAQKLSARGVQVLESDSLGSALGALRQAGLRSLFVEGGPILAGALLSGGFVDRLIIFQVPVLLGPGALPAWSAAPPVGRLGVIERQSFDDDEMTVYALTQLAV